MADEKKVADVKLAGVALDLVCTNEKCDDKGKVIETVELTEEDFTVENGKNFVLKGEETFECDECDTEYVLPKNFIFKVK